MDRYELEEAADEYENNDKDWREAEKEGLQEDINQKLWLLSWFKEMDKESSQ